MITCLLAPSLSLKLALLPLLPSFHQEHLPSLVYISFLCLFTNYSLNLHNLPWKLTLPPLPVAYSKCFLPVLNISTPQVVCARAHQALSWNHSCSNRHCHILLPASLPHLSQHLYLFLALLLPPLSDLTSLLSSHLQSPSPHPTLTSLCLAWDTCAPLTSPNLLFLQTCLFLYIAPPMCVCVSAFGHSVMSNTLWPHGALQAPLSMEFPQQEYWSGLLFSSPGDLPDPGITLTSLESPALQADSLPTEPLVKDSTT